MLLAESFIFGCFGVLNKSLDLDLIYGFHSNYAKKHISTLSIQL
ncbi:antitermination protein Q [Xenorhabdus szentirmaii]|uniref:DLP12 prophage antitermination protein Q n=2 Tax=Xenorhabdus szentirmaii TaxID=290112 RepID=W1J1I8_9GAMM